MSAYCPEELERAEQERAAKLDWDYADHLIRDAYARGWRAGKRWAVEEVSFWQEISPPYQTPATLLYLLREIDADNRIH